MYIVTLELSRFTGIIMIRFLIEFDPVRRKQGLHSIEALNRNKFLSIEEDKERGLVWKSLVTRGG